MHEYKKPLVSNRTNNTYIPHTTRISNLIYIFIIYSLFRNKSDAKIYIFMCYLNAIYITYSERTGTFPLWKKGWDLSKSEKQREKESNTKRKIYKKERNDQQYRE